MKYQNYTQLKHAKAMRREPTESEARLWKVLRGRQLLELKFRRQVGFGPFIADFYCSDAKLVIEADGSQHADNIEYDAKRSEFFVQEGFIVMRFWNNEILQNLEGVLEMIGTVAMEQIDNPSPSNATRGPLPLPDRERDT